MPKENYSVLMSVYKSEKPEFLRQSMQSIYDQTIPTNDFVLLCDGPLSKHLDNVIDEMKKKFGKRLQVVRLNENHGLGYCLRTGILKCKNDLIARMDSDDISREDRCEKELDYLSKHPDISVVGSLVAEFRTSVNDIESVRRVPESNDEIVEFAKKRNPINHPSAMFRKKDVLASGNYPEVRKCQDWYLWTKMLMDGCQFYNIQEALVFMREDGTTFKRRAGWDYFKIQKDLFKSMRKGKFISLPQYMTVIPVRFCSAMAPNSIREALFKRFMREEAKDKKANFQPAVKHIYDGANNSRPVEERKTHNTSKYIIFIPYFGKLPTSFNLWLESCSNNKDFTFIIFTDDNTDYDIPKNVKMIYTSFDSFGEKVQQKFDFEISLEKSYKLCDYKPTYGYIFSDYVKGYDYWGHCDLDLVFGDIKKFLPKKEYDKISYHGHFCLYRNQEKINQAFMNSDSSVSYADILSHSQNFAFDEIGDYGINRIFERNGFSIYDFQSSVADIDCRHKRLYRREKKDSRSSHTKIRTVSDSREKLFIFDSGKVYSYDIEKQEIDNEYAYVHLQKRKMSNSVTNERKFVITYNGFVNYPPRAEGLQDFSPKSRLDLRLIKVKMNTVPKRVKRELAIMRLRHMKKG